MSKNKFVSFNVTFVIPAYLKDATTARKQCESIFIQSQICADEIFKAIAALNPEDGLGDADMSDSEIRFCTQTLAFIGQGFSQTMYEQFQQIIGNAEAKNEQSK